MSYSLLILPRAQREIASVPTEAQDRIEAAILSLADQPRPATSKKLTGREGWRIRVGDYRVIYEIDDSARTVLILDVGHRRDVYR